MKKRSEIKEQDQWDLRDLYESDEAWQKDYERLEQAVDQVTSYAGTLGESSQKLLAFLQYQDEMDMITEDVFVYSNQKLHQDLTCTASQELAAKAQMVMVKLASAASFVQPEILAIPKETLERFMEEEPGLAPFRKSLEDLLRKKAHVLDQKTEEILAKAENISQGPSDIYSMFDNADARFDKPLDSQGQEHDLTHGTFTHLEESSDRVLRKNAFQNMYGLYDRYKNTVTSIFAANVKQASFYADVRGYSSARAMYLDDSNIPEQVYDNLIDVTVKNLDLMHRYVSIRKKALGVEELHLYDVYTPMVSDVDMGVPFEEAKKIVKEGLAPLGEEYLSHLQEGFDNRWIDIYENEGKRSGAYSWGTYRSHPYVMLNYQQNLDNIFTLAHEMGHSMHSWYSDHTQPHACAGYKIFVAEVASTCNEALLNLHLIEHCQDPKKKALLINSFLEHFKGTLYRQVMFAHFERDAHEAYAQGKSLTPELLCDMYYKLNEQYFGPDMVVDQEIALEWARIPHFYTPFYVYQYATGFSAAIALANRIRRQGQPAVEDYMKFLTGGGSKDPLELLKLAGVDMSTTQPVEEALAVFKDLLDEFEQTL